MHALSVAQPPVTSQRPGRGFTTMRLFNNRTTALAAGATILVLGGAGGAVAAGQITGQDIKDDSIYSRDIHDGTLHSWDFSRQAMRSLKGARGPQGAQGPQGPQGPAGPKGEPGDAAKYDGPNWSIIDRSTIGNGDAYLRSGPSYVDPSVGTVQPPLGVGSLGLRTGSGQDKADFGDQVDFAGHMVSDLQTLKYSIFTTGENNAVSPGNLPNLTFEIDPNNPAITGSNGNEVHYTSMVYVPAGQAPGWKEHDASEDTTNGGSSGWYFTNGATAAATGCTQATYCTLADAKKNIPDAKILTVAISKGRDNPFSGAVDALVINTATYDFEPFGVTASTV